MRVVLLSFLGSLLMASEAMGEPVLGCKLDGLELVEEGSEEVPGSQRFYVLKVESHFWRLSGPDLNDYKPDGYVKILVESRGHKYVITQTYRRYGFPANSGVSEVATPKRVREIDPKRRSREGERKRVNGAFMILGGPLGEETALMPVKCR